MPFGRLHEEAAGESKLLALSDAAWRMWAAGLIYCQKNLTDGFIPDNAITTFGVRGVDADALLAALAQRQWPGRVWDAIRAIVVTLRVSPREVAKELCAPQVPGRAPLWSRADGGYQVHDYLQWNDSKDEILAGRTKAKNRIERWRQRQAQDAARNGERDGAQNGVTNASSNALRTPLDDASPVVRGSGALLKERSGAPVGGSVFSGALPREHLSHAFCDNTFARCVPNAVHDKLANQLAPKHAGDRQAAKAELAAWYPTVWASLPDDFVMPDAFKFWQARFDVTFASKDVAVAKPEPRSAVPSAEETRERQRRLREAAQ